MTLARLAADLPLRSLHMGLHVAAPFALVILELAARCPERIAQGDVGVLVAAIRRMGVSDRDLLVGKGDVDSEVIEEALVLVMSRRLHDDMAAHDVLAESLESRGELANAGLERRGGVHMTKGDLQRKYHGLSLDGPHEHSSRVLICAGAWNTEKV